MKSIIKLFILLFIVILIVLTLWGRPILERAGSYILKTPVVINKVKLTQYKLMYRLYGISLPEKNVLIMEGNLFLIPPKLELYGIKILDNIVLTKKDFFASLARKKNWEITSIFKKVDLKKTGFGFIKGSMGGSVEGVYSGGNCEFAGLLYIKDAVYSDGGSFLGMSAEELDRLTKTHGGTLELDFTYKGPVNEITELYRYKPGKKTIGLIRDYIVQKIFK